MLQTMFQPIVVVGIVLLITLGFTLVWKLRELHLTMNSRLDQLIKASVSQGRQDERDAQKGIVKMEEILKDKGLLP